MQKINEHSSDDEDYHGKFGALNQIYKKQTQRTKNEPLQGLQVKLTMKEIEENIVKDLDKKYGKVKTFDDIKQMADDAVQGETFDRQK